MLLSRSKLFCHRAVVKGQLHEYNLDEDNTMNIRGTETEICITDLLAAFLKACKPILCITLALALLGGLWGAYKAVDAAKHPEVTQEDIDKAEAALRDAEKKQTDAEKSLKKLSETEIPDAEKKVERARLLVQRRQEYLDKSLYYAMNPFHRGVSRVTLFVDTDTPVNPNAPWLSVNPQSSVVIAYTKIYPFDSEIMENIQRIMGVDAEPQYINELVSVSNISNQFVEIRVFFDDAEVAKQVTDYLLETLQTRLAETVGEYSSNIVGYFVGYEVDWGMSDSHNANDDNMLSAERALSDAEEALQTLKTQTKDDREQAVEDAKTAAEDAGKNLRDLQEQFDNTSADPKNVVKKAAKYAVIGLVTGVFLGCVLVFMLGVLGGKIQDINSVVFRYAFPVIGVLPDRKQRWFAKTIRKLEGEPEADFETAGRTMAESLSSVIGDRKVALVSSEGNDIIDAVLPFLNGRIPVCGDILRDANAVKAAMEYDGLVLVEKREKSRFDQVDNEVRRIESMGKKIEGIILL